MQLRAKHTIKSLHCCSNNRLTRLPDEIGQLVKLETLIVSRNQLSSLPSSVANLKNLRDVDCSVHQISTFPVGLTNSKTLTVVDLKSNKFFFPLKLLFFRII